MATERKGRLIAFEGIDGTGKTTQIALLAAELRSRGHEVVASREPTNGIYGQRIRALYSNRGAVGPAEELALFVADRRQHVEELIAPALAAGKVVLTDRYYLSTAAYQGALGNDPEEIMRINEEFAPRPDLVLLLEVPVGQGLSRITTLRQETPNDFEQESGLQKVAAVFQRLDRPFIRRLDGTQSIAEVQAAIRRHVLTLW